MTRLALIFLRQGSIRRDGSIRQPSSRCLKFLVRGTYAYRLARQRGVVYADPVRHEVLDDLGQCAKTL